MRFNFVILLVLLKQKILFFLNLNKFLGFIIRNLRILINLQESRIEKKRDKGEERKKGRGKEEEKREREEDDDDDDIE